MMAIQSKADFDRRGEPKTVEDPPLAGTMPYQFDERSLSAFIRYTRTPGTHWRNTPDFPELEVRFSSEASTRLAGLLVGEIHVTELPSDLLQQAVGQGMKIATGGVPGLRVFAQFRGVYYVNDDPSKPLMNPDSVIGDLRVRKALSKSVNRAELNGALFGGKGQTMFLNHFHPTRLGYDATWEQRYAEEYGYDPRAARALLEEAGYGPNNPATITFVLAPRSGLPAPAEDIIEALGGYFSDVGVDLKLQAIDSATSRARTRAREWVDAMTLGATSSRQGVGFSVYASVFGIGGAYIQTLQTEKIYNVIVETLDLEKQAALWNEVGEITFMGHNDVPLFWLAAEIGYNPKIVADYIFPGSITGSWTHAENIKAAR